MALFDFLKSKPKADLTIEIKTPVNFETNSFKLPVRVIFASKTPQKIISLVVRLRADSTKKKRDPGAKAYQYLGEAVQPQELLVDPAKSTEAYFELPFDFSPIDSFEIPPENLAVASAEMKAAAASNRTVNYRYSIEVTYKTENGHEQVASQPIKLVQPDEVRIG